MKRIYSLSVFIVILGVFLFSCKSTPEPVESVEPAPAFSVNDSVTLVIINSSQSVSIGNLWLNQYIVNPLDEANRKNDILSDNKGLAPGGTYVVFGTVPGDYSFQEYDSNMKTGYYGWWGSGEVADGSAVQKMRSLAAGTTYVIEFKDNGSGDVILSFREEDYILK